MKQINKIGVTSLLGSYTGKTIVAHPENISLIKKDIMRAPERSYIFMPFQPLHGLNIIEDVNCPIFATEWVFPADRFTIYEKSDEKWAIPVGHGSYKVTEERVFFLL